MALVPATLAADLKIIADQVEQMAKAGQPPAVCKQYYALQTALAFDRYIRTGQVNLLTGTIF